MGVSEKRRQHIRNSIKNNGTVAVSKLAEELNVSEMTIRRDLSDLEREGFLKRIHGGAVREASRSYEPPFTVRQDISSEAKRRIALRAASYVEDGETIAVDSGTTALEFARQLHNFRHLTIVTPSIHIATVFLSNPGIEIILAGGTVRKHEGSLVGDLTRSVFERLYFDKFFLSTAGLSCEAGYTEYILEDAEIKKLIISHSKKTIALMDSAKLGKTAFSLVCGLKDADILVTDTDPKSELKFALHKSRVIIDIADNLGGTK